MIKLLAKKFIENSENVNNKEVRKSYGILSGVLGIICNILLFVVKITIGLIIKSVAVVSDAFNNLSDMGSSLIGIFSAKVSNKKPDKKHPYGHGRIEYIASLIVSFIIVFVGFQLLTSSFNKVIHNEVSVVFNIIPLIILAISVFIKIWMYFYNRYISKKINSQILKATAMDSLSDAITTLFIILSTFIGHYLLPKFPVDGVAGILVSIIIIINGIKLTLETINLLLGAAPTKELCENIEKIVLGGEYIIGVHDLIVHDYGPGRKMASIHAEIPDNANILLAHEVIDSLEKKVENELDIHLVIHMDPVSTNCEQTNKLREIISEILLTIHKDLSFHDLRITDGVNNVNVIFDLVIPFDMTNKEKDDIIEHISQKLKEIDNKYSTVINIDYH